MCYQITESIFFLNGALVEALGSIQGGDFGMNLESTQPLT